MPGCQCFDYLLRTNVLQQRLIKQRKPINIHSVRAERARRTAREGRAQETYNINSIQSTTVTRDLLHSRVGPNDTYSTSFFYEISAFYRSAKVESSRVRTSVGSQNNRPPSTEPSLKQQRSRKTPTRLSTGVSLTRRHVSVPWGVKSITNSSRYNAQRDKSLSCCRQRARSVGRLGAVTLSTRRRELGSSLRILRSDMTCQ